MSRAHSAAPLADAPDLEAAAAVVRSRGLRLSTARRLVLEALYEADGPLTADQLAGDMDIASVYRNLETLEEIGLVRHVHLGHGPGLYARSSAGAHEYLLCDACGAVDGRRARAARRRARPDPRRSSATRRGSRTSRSPGCCPDCRRTSLPTPDASAGPGSRARLTPPEWRRAGALTAVDRRAARDRLLRPARARRAAGPASWAAARCSASGSGITAYTLGMRHAFDADHIGAIDNVTRKLMNEGQRPLSVGFFFSLGHSTIVFALATLLAFGIRGLSGAVDERQLDAAPGHRPDRPERVRVLPAADRDPEPGRPRRHRQGLPAHAPRRATTRRSSRSSSTRAAS